MTDKHQTSTVFPDQMQDQEDQRPEDQHFEEVLYEPSGGGWKTLLLIAVILLVCGVPLFVISLVNIGNPIFKLTLVLSCMCGFASFIICICTLSGITCIDPNQAVFITFCTKYVGTIKKNGVYWTHPLYNRSTMSLVINNFETSMSKVNDANGTPIMIQTVIVWKVRDTAKATYAVDNYESFLHTQAESAMRTCAALYPYECEDESPSLRGSPVEVSATLRQSVQDRVDKVGLEIVEAKISHLAFAPEIAASMLKKQ